MWLLWRDGSAEQAAEKSGPDEKASEEAKPDSLTDVEHGHKQKKKKQTKNT